MSEGNHVEFEKSPNISLYSKQMQHIIKIITIISLQLEIPNMCKYLNKHYNMTQTKTIMCAV